jgi:ZIP family zinc transporter
MTTGQTVLLGAIAGSTIYLGLPMGRLRTSSVRLKIFLSGLSAGILVFLLVEIFEHAFSSVETALERAQKGGASWGPVAGLGSLYAAGILVGMMGLYYVLKRRQSRPRQSIGPGAMATAELAPSQLQRRQALELGMSIAIAIGLHNFSEGLAIGQSAAKGETTLALLLVIGFALHNATEGFGIVGPLAGADVVASWKWIGAAGLVGGGPTFIGTLIGRSVQSDYLFTGFLALAGGAVLFVVAELFAAGRKTDWHSMLWGTGVGILAGAATELILVAAGR